jgi:hypothetical protein
VPAAPIIRAIQGTGLRYGIGQTRYNREDGGVSGKSKKANGIQANHSPAKQVGKNTKCTYSHMQRRQERKQPLSGPTEGSTGRTMNTAENNRKMQI